MAGNGGSGSRDGLYPYATLNFPTSICMNRLSTVAFIVDAGSLRLRKLDLLTLDLISVGGLSPMSYFVNCRRQLVIDPQELSSYG